MRGEELVLAVVERHTGTLVGCVGLQLSRAHSHAELGYWVAPPAWGKGVATEASRALVGHAFTELRMQRVWAQHFSRNVASGRVMQKIGMRHEGTLRRHYRRFGELLDAEVYGLLSSEWVPGEGG